MVWQNEVTVGDLWNGSKEGDVKNYLARGAKNYHSNYVPGHSDDSDDTIPKFHVVGRDQDLRDAVVNEVSDDAPFFGYGLAELAIDEVDNYVFGSSNIPAGFVSGLRSFYPGDQEFVSLNYDFDLCYVENEPFSDEQIRDLSIKSLGVFAGHLAYQDRNYGLVSLRDLDPMRVAEPFAIYAMLESNLTVDTEKGREFAFDTLERDVGDEGVRIMNDVFEEHDRQREQRLSAEATEKVLGDFQDRVWWKEIDM